MEAVKLIRQYRSYKQLGLALVAGTSKARIAETENGTLPPVEILKNIARALNIKMWQIFYIEEHPELWNEQGIERVLDME